MSLNQKQSWTALSVLLIGCVALWANDLTAQGRGGTAAGFRGFVQDSAGRPLADVDVRTASAYVRSGADGSFFVPGKDGENATAVVRKLGYRPVQVLLHGSSGAAAAVDTVMLVPRIPTLDEVVVKGVPYNKRLWDEGFYRRQLGARGSFFDEAEVRFLAANGLVPLLRAVPRVEVEKQGSQDFAIGSAGSRACRMHIFVNGAYQWQAMPRMGANSAQGLRDLIDPAEIFAVEVYPTPVSVPPQFARMATGARSSGSQIPSPNTAMRNSPPADDPNSPCGAIIIWTKSWSERGASRAP